MYEIDYDTHTVLQNCGISSALTMQIPIFLQANVYMIR